MRNFTVPLHWDIGYIYALAKMQNTSARVVELYGCLNVYKLPNGRIPLDHQDIDIPTAQHIREVIRKCGFSFAYLVNGPLPNLLQSALELTNDLEKVLLDLDPDAFVISDPEIGRAIRNLNSTIPIHISSIASVETTAELDRFMDIAPCRLVLAHDLPKDPSKLLPLLHYCQFKEIMVECMVTESCLNRCPLKAQHYSAIASGSDDSLFHAYCLKERVSNPRKFLDAGSFLRPQDLYAYDELGIDIYKISGRSKGMDWLLRTIEIYLSGNYDGDLLEIMGVSMENRNRISFEVSSHTMKNIDSSSFQSNSQKHMNSTKETKRDSAL